MAVVCLNLLDSDTHFTPHQHSLIQTPPQLGIGHAAMLNLSLSGCGFLGIYHIGVVSAFREHAPELLQHKMTGASAGALVAACALCDCCLGQMVGDTIEIALKARSHALGPLHPSFRIVDILRNGLRRILPIDAHKICSGRLLISLTRWKDGKNVLVSEFDSREDLIQALICSSFVPMYSGFFPPKFKGAYYWDGGLSNNNPVLDEYTIKVSPFGGESDICPRDETGAFSCLEFQGTNIQWSNENVYRLAIALFPPNPEVLKAICFRGYKDAITFLRARNLLHCSCLRHVREKTSISSVVGEDLHDLTNHIEENRAIYEAAYDEVSDMEEHMDEEEDEEDKIIQYAHANDSLKYQEMSNTVCEVLDAACQDEKNLLNYIFNSQIIRAISLALLPWTLPLEISLNFTKRIIELIPRIQVSPNSTNIRDHLFVYFNLLVEKLTHDKYQYHTRVSCKLCVMASTTNNNYSKQHVCRHTPRHSKPDIKAHLEDEQLAELSPKSLVKLKREAYFPKFCARHHRPTEGSDASNLLSELASTRSRRRSPSGRSQFSVNSAGSKFERRSLKYFAKYKA